MRRLVIAATLIGVFGFFSYKVISENSIHLAAYNGNEDAVKELLKKKLDIEDRDNFGGTALHGAMFQDNVNIIQMLIDYGYDINAQGTKNQYTPAHDAVWADNLAALKILVENGADLTIKAKDGYTPLEKAKKENKIEIVQYLENINKNN